MLDIIVCMKQVIDPEAPASSFRVDTEAKKVIPPKGTPPVLNPFDENALEAALRLKDKLGGRITVISLGRSLARPVVKKSLAVGADELVLLEDEAFAELDSHASAGILASAIKKAGKFDLILCGRQAADTDAGQTGLGIAEILGIPAISVARKIEVDSGKVVVERALPDGYEVVEAALPVLVTASNEIGALRAATVPAIIAARKKAEVVWKAPDLGIGTALRKVDLQRLYQPVHEGRCEVVAGETPEQAGASLAVKLREAGMI